MKNIEMSMRTLIIISFFGLSFSCFGQSDTLLEDKEQTLIVLVGEGQYDCGGVLLAKDSARFRSPYYNCVTERLEFEIKASKKAEEVDWNYYWNEHALKPVRIKGRFYKDLQSRDYGKDYPPYKVRVFLFDSLKFIK